MQSGLATVSKGRYTASSRESSLQVEYDSQFASVSREQKGRISTTKLGNGVRVLILGGFQRCHRKPPKACQLAFVDRPSRECSDRLPLELVPHDS